MAGIFGGGGSPAPAPQPPTMEKPQVMPIKDEEVDRQNQIKIQARAMAGKTTRRNTIIGADDEGL